ncbi:MAG: FAD-dependent oxidoreductase [Kiritimatiellia bacterium]
MNPSAERCDVAVVGAGTAGLVAALAAARGGARVVLIEAGERVGGLAIHGLHRFVCGLFRNGGARPGEPLHGPATMAFCRRLAGGDPEQLAVRRGRVWLLPFAGGEALAACAEQEIAAAKNIRLVRGDPAVRAERAGERIAEIALASGGVIEPATAIDCTGSASLCHMVGAQVERPAHPALAGYGFEIAGVDESQAGPLGLSMAVPYLLRQEVAAGRLAPHLAYTTWEPAAGPGQGWIKLALPTEAVSLARDQADAVWGVLNKAPALARARILRHLSAPLARETGHVRGAYVLTEADVLSARDFPDAVAHNAWPIELWEDGHGVTYRYLPDGQAHGIPLRCLQPKNGPANLLCAGAAISAQPAAAAAIRVMGVCMALGEAAAAHCGE